MIITTFVRFAIMPEKGDDFKGAKFRNETQTSITVDWPGAELLPPKRDVEDTVRVAVDTAVRKFLAGLDDGCNRVDREGNRI